MLPLTRAPGLDCECGWPSAQDLAFLIWYFTEHGAAVEDGDEEDEESEGGEGGGEDGEEPELRASVRSIRSFERMMSERGGKLKRARKARDSAVGSLSLTATSRIRTAHLFSFFSVSAPCRHPFQTCIIPLMNHSPGTQKANMAHLSSSDGVLQTFTVESGTPRP